MRDGTNFVPLRKRSLWQVFFFKMPLHWETFCILSYSKPISPYMLSCFPPDYTTGCKAGSFFSPYASVFQWKELWWEVTASLGNWTIFNASFWVQGNIVLVDKSSAQSWVRKLITDSCLIAIAAYLSRLGSTIDVFLLSSGFAYSCRPHTQWRFGVVFSGTLEVHLNKAWIQRSLRFRSL